MTNGDLKLSPYLPDFPIFLSWISIQICYRLVMKHPLQAGVFKLSVLPAGDTVLGGCSAFMHCGLSSRSSWLGDLVLHASCYPQQWGQMQVSATGEAPASMLLALKLWAIISPSFPKWQDSLAWVCELKWVLLSCFLLGIFCNGGRVADNRYCTIFVFYLLS